MRLNLRYVQERTIGLDMLILLHTVPTVVPGCGAHEPIGVTPAE